MRVPFGNAVAGRKGGREARNEPSWETGERGSDVVVLFATAAAADAAAAAPPDSRFERRGKERKRASARATRRVQPLLSLYRIANEAPARCRPPRSSPISVCRRLRGI